jgi:hypothetical protein
VVDHPGGHEEEPVLVPVRSHQHVHTCRRARREPFERGPRENVAVHDRLEGQEVHDELAPPRRIRPLQFATQLRLRGVDPLRRHGAQTRRGGGHPQVGGDEVGDAACGPGRERVLCGSALQHRPSDQPCGARHREQRAAGHGACRLADDGHRARVAAERRDVVAHPFQGRNLVEKAEVRRRVGQEREPLDAEPVVDRDGDEAVAGERGPVRQRYGAGPVDERAAVDPHEDGQPTRARVGSPDTQVEVLVAWDRGVRHERVVRGEKPGIGAVGPCATASRTPVQRGTGSGARKRRSPTGAAAYGIPRKATTPSFCTPRTVPHPVVTVMEVTVLTRASVPEQ